MSEIHKHTHLLLNCLGTVGSIVSGYISEYMTEQDIKRINSRINTLNSKLEKFDIFKYKIINRIKIRNLLVKVLSEESEVFIELSVKLLELSEENFENIIDGFMILTQNDIDVLYHNLWKKRNNDKFDISQLKEEINNNYEFTPDLIMSYEYRVNKEEFISNKNGIIVGESLTLMPNLESSNIFNVFEKLSYNNFIKLSKYIPNIKKDFFETYLCFNFTYLGIYLCKIMEELELQRKEKKMENIRYAVRVFAFKDNKVVCIKYKSINKDYFDIPGGKIEDGETEVQTCIREFKEETGMDIEDLRCIGKVEIIYPGQERKFIMKTYIANKVNGIPQNLEDNYAYWMPISELTKNEKRFAITHLMDEDLIKYFNEEKLNITFICDDNHNIIDMKI